MKSAYEIAMSRLETESPTVKLTDAQRAEIAEIDNQSLAKIAERRIFIEDEIKAAAGDRLALDQLQQQLASEIRRLEDECETRKERVRSSAG